MRISAICVTKQPKDWNLPDIPIHFHAGGHRSFPRVRTRERIEYLAEIRNAGAKDLLERFPRTEYILNVDSYYVEQFQAIMALVSEYETWIARFGNPPIILGASNWFKDQTIWPAAWRFWDSWTTPEGLRYRPSATGWVRVKAVGGVFIYPRWVFEKIGYGVPEPFPSAGCENNYMQTKAGLSVYLSLNVKTIHPTVEVYSLPRRVRKTLALGRICRWSSTYRARSTSPECPSI